MCMCVLCVCTKKKQKKTRIRGNAENDAENTAPYTHMYMYVCTSGIPAKAKLSQSTMNVKKREHKSIIYYVFAVETLLYISLTCILHICSYIHECMYVELMCVRSNVFVYGNLREYSSIYMIFIVTWFCGSGWACSWLSIHLVCRWNVIL